MKLANEISEFVLESTSASEVGRVNNVQSLWSGYGQICRVELVGGPIRSVIIKHVAPPNLSSHGAQHRVQHPRGWSGDRSHARKLRSYEVETNWYENFSALCDVGCRVPRCWATRHHDGEFLFVLEDLDEAGYPLRRGALDRDGIFLGLDWLANFHSRFFGVAPDGLWEVGTYWHLATRPDEWDAMEPGSMKDAAIAIDLRLRQCVFQSLVHGDAKVANFCFANDASKIAAVDFQYVGGGCGMKDVAYFLGSCLDGDECERGEEAFLDHYFAQFRNSLATQHQGVSPDDVENEWRALYPFAWADFTRFMMGWCSSHTKLNRYSRRIVEQVTQQLK